MGENLTEMDFSPQQGSLETLVVWDQHAQDSALFVLPLLQGWLLCPAKASGIVREGFCSLPVHVPTSPGWDVVGNGPALLSTDLPQQQAGAGGDSTRDQGTLSLARGLRARPSPVCPPQAWLQAALQGAGTALPRQMGKDVFPLICPNLDYFSK